MDDPINQNAQGMPGDVPPPPPMGGIPPPPPPMGGPMGVGAGEPPHEEILAALKRIEEKLAAIAAKVGV